MIGTDAKTQAKGPLQRLVGSLLGLLQSHLGLFSLEMEEVRDRLAKTLVLAVLGSGTVLLALLTAIVGILLMVDDAHRWLVVIGLLVFLLAMAGICLGLAWRGIRQDPPPFAATLEELRRDRERLLP